jgi:hypothetical protein
MNRCLPFLLATALCASSCESPPPLEPLRILQVEPLTQKSNESKVVLLTLDADPSVLVNYGEPSATLVGEPRMTIGPRTVPLTYLGHGQFKGYVEPLVAGDYTVGVNLGDGREAAFDTPYKVISVAWATYEFARIDPQVQGQPFRISVTVNVHGQVAGEPAFQGQASLMVYRGGKLAYQADLTSLAAGVNSHEVTINQAGDDFVAQIEDAEGEQAFSNSFPVNPP